MKHAIWNNHIGDLVIIKLGSFIMDFPPMLCRITDVAKNESMWPVLAVNIDTGGNNTVSLNEIIGIISKNNKLVRLALGKNTIIPKSF